MEAEKKGEGRGGLKLPPSVLVLVTVIRAYREVDDTGGLGNLLFLLLGWLEGEAICLDALTPLEKMALSSMCETAANGVENYHAMGRGRSKGGKRSQEVQRAKRAALAAANAEGADASGVLDGKPLV